MMTARHVLDRLLGRHGDREGDAKHISAAARRDILRRELMRGVDLPTWRTPREIADMYGRQEGGDDRPAA